MLFLKFIVTYSYYINEIFFENSQNFKTNSKNENWYLEYPNIYNTVLMTYNSYFLINDTNWKKIPYNTTEINIDPNLLKAFIFYGQINNENVYFITIKGTTLFNKNDRFNDNLLFSCCYYKESQLFNKTCELFPTKNNECNKSCFNHNLINQYPNYYFKIGKIIVENIKKLIPFDNSKIFFIGHSLGGIIATYLGIYFNKIVLSYLSPGEKHFFDLVNIKNNNDNVYHFTHNADLISNGKCGNYCWSFGYNIYTKCHTGFECIFDAKKKLNISESLQSHKLDYFIKYILPYWENDLPICIKNTNCTEFNCKKWNFID